MENEEEFYVCQSCGYEAEPDFFGQHCPSCGVDLDELEAEMERKEQTR